jgi:ABC-type sugar transport system permease subunit
MKDKRGITFNLIIIICLMLVGVIVIGILGFVFSSIYSGLNQDVLIGSVNMSNVTEQTYGTFNTAFNNNLDLFGLFLIFGMIGGLLIASFLMRGKWDKLLIVVDLILLVVVYIVAVVISNTYETLLTASAGVISQFEGSMPKTSNFLLHLPRYVSIIGAVCMILFYSGIPKRENEQQINYEGGNY